MPSQSKTCHQCPFILKISPTGKLTRSFDALTQHCVAEFTMDGGQRLISRVIGHVDFGFLENLRAGVTILQARLSH